MYKNVKDELLKIISLPHICRANQSRSCQAGQGMNQLVESYKNKERSELENYLHTLNEGQLKAIITIMYLGRDGNKCISPTSSSKYNEKYSEIFSGNAFEKKEFIISHMIRKVELKNFIAKGMELLNMLD